MPKGCRFGGSTKANGNCTEPGDDGLPVQCVSAWARDKHDILRRYIEATRTTRGKYLSPNPGGAAFVDLGERDPVEVVVDRPGCSDAVTGKIHVRVAGCQDDGPVVQDSKRQDRR